MITIINMKGIIALAEAVIYAIKIRVYGKNLRYCKKLIHEVNVVTAKK
jgi:hypothetical protein